MPNKRRVIPPKSHLAERERHQEAALKSLPMETLEALNHYNQKAVVWRMEEIPPELDMLGAAQKLIERGMAAKECLQNPSFVDAYQLLLSDLVNTNISLHPSQYEEKQVSAFEIQALQDIIKKLSSFVSQAEHLKRTLADSEADEPRQKGFDYE